MIQVHHGIGRWWLRSTKADIQGIPRCTDLLASLLSLSLSLDYSINEMTILRARATRLGFSLLPNATKDEQADEDDRDQEEVQADIDVLPTLLVYLDGELVKNWVRVDWEVKEDGVEGLLKRYVPPLFPPLRMLSSSVWGPEVVLILGKGS